MTDASSHTREPDRLDKSTEADDRQGASEYIDLARLRALIERMRPILKELPDDPS